MTEARREGLGARLPATAREFRSAGAAFGAELQDLKRRLPGPSEGWYPYETIQAVPLISELLAPVYEEVCEAVAQRPVVDIGCGDGDFAMWFARMGCAVDAIDHAENNFNQLRGAPELARALSLEVHTYDIDLDRAFEFPRTDYALALFLGTLYHLKNPFSILETLAARADWCLLSTRIAQVTPTRRLRMEEEPLAYLLGHREANQDPTNFWIFSMTGLGRLVERTGWMEMGSLRQGCRIDSNPADAAADERVLVLMKSRVRHPSLHVRPLEGWHAAENDAFRWTARRFSLDVAVPDGSREFALRFWAPEAALAAGAVRICCVIGGQAVGALTCDSAAPLEFRGRFPEAGTKFRLDFTVESGFQPEGDSRELGICVPLVDASQRHTQRIPFRIS